LISEKDINTISTLFDLLIEERELRNLYAEVTEKSILEILFAVTLRLMGKPIAASPEKDTMHKAIAYIQTNFTRPLPLSETATAVGLNRTYFSELFTQKMGRGYNQYLTNLRIEYAKRLLQSSSMRINEICYECGFSSISAFLQAFRKTTNTTTAKYRRQHL
jgi:AraC-like DNA-binding protein